MAAIWDGRIVSESALTTRLNVARNALRSRRRKSCVAIGDYVLDLWELEQDGRLDVGELGADRGAEHVEG